ncbi:MAG: SIMPL domain-containing protein [Rhodospirillales bacterium]|nr:SIMPL domain-containing protein [Rhodospirillales bacterium]
MGEPVPHQDEACALAVKNARHRAETIAKAAGIELGYVLQIREGSISIPRPPVYARAQMAAESVPVVRGELTISARLIIAYEID